MSPYVFPVGNDVSVTMALDTSKWEGDLKRATLLTLLRYVNSL